MLTPRARVIACIAATFSIGMLTDGLASPLHAQAPAYFTLLSVPPSTVGTCLPSVLPSNAAATRPPGPRLVMTHRSPSARREISLTRDSTGAVIGLHETIQLSTGRTTGTGESVVAALRGDGTIVGSVFRTQTAMPDSGTPKFDSASLRRRRESIRQTSSQSALDVKAQDQVRVLVSWLAKRCAG